MVVYGKQIFLYVLEKYPQMIQKVYLSKDIDKKLFSQISKLNKEIIKLNNKKAQALAKGGNHQGFFLDIEYFKYTSLEDMKRSKFLLVLSGVTDVGNIGAIIRSAYALGVDGVILSGIKTINTSAIMRTSSGALLDMPLAIFPDTLTLLNELKQIKFFIYSADMSGDDVREVSFDQKKVLLLGSEGDGLSKKILAKSDRKISIKMARDFDSLNVSVAFAILCDRMR